MTDCEKCGLQYSSYCIGCKNEMNGIGMTVFDYAKAKTGEKEREENERTEID